VELWRQGFRFLKTRLKRTGENKGAKKKVEVPLNQQPAAAAPEVVHHFDRSEGASSSTVRGCCEGVVKGRVG